MDMYNAMNNSWTTFPTGLGQARVGLAAASLPSGLVFFAGGFASIETSACVCQMQRLFLCCRDLATTVLLRCCVPLMLLYTACVCGGCCADAFASDSGPSTYVDMYNAVSNSWTTFATGLGQGRDALAAASLPSGLVFFAGGWEGIGTSVCVCQLRRLSLCCRDLTTTVILCCCVPLMLLHTACVCGGGCADACASGGAVSAYVDMYNATSNRWTTFPTGLGQARQYLAAASLPSGLVFFAGGDTGIGTRASVRQLRRVFLFCRDLTTTVILCCCVPLMLLHTACVCGGGCADA